MHICVFDSACRVNLDAFYAALANPNLTPESFWADWRPEINSEMDKCEAAAVEAFKSVLHTGFDAVTAALYIHGNLIFHKFPLLSDPKWFKAGGIPALFNPGASLKEHRYIWSILADSTAPSKAAVLQEKTRAIDQTRASLKTLNRLRGRLPEALLQIHTEAWRNLETLATVVHKLCCTVYEARDFNASSQPIPSPVTISTPGQNNGSYAELMIEPITQLTARIAAEVPAERALRQECQRRFPTVHDLILPGGLRDDGRCCRSALHASQAWLHESGMLIRQIGNPIFPNGWLEVELHQTTKQTLPQRLIFKGISNPTGFHLSLAGQSQIFTVILNADGWDEFNLPPEWSSHLKKDRSLRIRLTKAGRSYPQLAAILLV